MSTETPRSEALGRYLRGWPALAVVVITIGWSFWTYDLVEYALVNGVYGTDAWNHGLRVTDKKGHLSDGRELSGFHRAVLNYGSYLLCVPIFLGSAFGFAYLNMRIHGKRLSDLTAAGGSPGPGAADPAATG
jgi:hypothetical protein